MILKKTTKITAIENKGSMIVVKDQDGDSYSFFINKQDGTNTQAYNDYMYGYHNSQIIPGLDVQLSYTEKTSQNKFGKTVTYKNIIGMLCNFASGTSIGEMKNSAPSGKFESTAYKERDYDAENVGKCMSLFLQAFIQSGKSFSDAKLQVTQARQLAELVVYGRQKSGSENFADALKESGILVVDCTEPEDIDPKDIPF